MTRPSRYIALTKDFFADLETPVSLFLKLSKKSTSSFLLESVEQGEALGRYSFLGFDPEAVFCLYEGYWEITSGKNKKIVRYKDPLDLLKKELAVNSRRRPHSKAAPATHS